MAIICDLNHTLFIPPEDADPFDVSLYEKYPVDRNILWILLDNIERGVNILFLTARSEASRNETAAALHRIGVTNSDTRLFMRSPGDNRPDYEVKRDLFTLTRQDYPHIHFVLEDRPDCVEMWKSLGLTVLQVHLRKD